MMVRCDDEHCIMLQREPDAHPNAERKDSIRHTVLKVEVKFEVFFFDLVVTTFQHLFWNKNAPR